MNINKTSSACLILIGIIIFASCSPVKIASIEKRRYMDGYYVQSNSNRQRHLAHDAKPLSIKTPTSNSEFSESVSVETKTTKPGKDKKEIKKVKTVFKEFKKGKNKERLITALNDIAGKADLIDSHKNQTRIPKHKNKMHDGETVDPAGSDRFGTGESAIVLLVVIALLLILLMKDVLVAILVAVVLVLLIIWLLRELQMID